ncbi:mechanosensitive ion channel family protein [Streptomyces alkaliphilus]|uniref:mechanosensitive ion channel family protein n=1 Tax=Streptomyces alkaliphilus TaxID=1472722 RepID=UPI001180499D|nr:mechanosensitive ion channel domain-containing protein [Streptomyces alkaliphilus]MQS07545.1 mechanosensitive ion channel [Streptomyces alkaliphilus]
MNDVLRPVLVLGGAVVIAVALGWLIDRGLRTATRRKPENRLPQLLRRCQPPLQVLLVSVALQLAHEPSGLDIPQNTVIATILAVITTASCAWLAIVAAGAVAENILASYAGRTDDIARVRQFRTQLTIVRRVVTTILAVVASAIAIVVLFPALRTLGASMLASAGVLGIIAGVAAQSMLGNLFAGLQIAFGDSVKIGDTVVVEGEWGTVEEISLAFITIRIWDDRRLTMPVSHFNGQPYENWSRGGHEITGTVFLYLDHSAPVAELREHLRSFLLGRKEWDGRSWSLVVTDTTASTIEVRAAMSAANSSDVWDLRCVVREELISWLHREHPYALPRINTAPAVLPGPRAAPDGSGPDTGKAGEASARADTGNGAAPPRARRGGDRRG